MPSVRVYHGIEKIGRLIFFYFLFGPLDQRGQTLRKTGGGPMASPVPSGNMWCPKRLNIEEEAPTAIYICRKVNSFAKMGGVNVKKKLGVSPQLLNI
jgi:hypothetical protein